MWGLKHELHLLQDSTEENIEVTERPCRSPVDFMAQPQTFNSIEVENGNKNVNSHFDLMLQTSLFSSTEVENFKQKTEAMDSALDMNKKDTYLRNIKFNCQILSSIKQRIQKQPIPKNPRLNEVHNLFLNRVHNLMLSSVKYFPDELHFIQSYFRFCSDNPMMMNLAKPKLQDMLKQKGDSFPQLYQVAIECYSKCGATAEALECLMEGVNCHNDPALFKFSFKYLLEEEKKKRSQTTERKEIDPNESTMITRKAESVYTYIKTKTVDIELLNDLLELCGKYSFASSLERKISHDLENIHRGDERIYGILATRELRNSQKKPATKTQIIKANEIYKNATTILNTPKMWCLYLDWLIEINSDKSKDIMKVLKQKLLTTGIFEAQKKINVPEKYCIFLCDTLQKEKHSEIETMIQTELVKQPHSLKLWEAQIKLFLSLGKIKRAMVVFKKGVDSLKEESLPLWTLMLKKLKRSKNLIQKVFEDGWTQPLKVSKVLRPMYLEWLATNHGILAARKQYKAGIHQPPHSEDMHQMMTKLEASQLTVNSEHIRYVHVNACAQLGKYSTAVWVDRLKFEKETDPSSMRDIYEQAVRQLPKFSHEAFFLHLQLLDLADEIFKYQASSEIVKEGA